MPAATAMRRSLQSRTPGRRGAVDQMRATLREQPRRLVADHPPVRDRDELGPAVPGIDAEMVDDVRQVLRRLVFSTSRKIARRPAGRGRSGSGGGMRPAKVVSTAERGQVERLSARRWTTTWAPGVAPRRARDGPGPPAFLRGFAPDAEREALPRAFLRLPSRFELIVTCRPTV